MEQKSIGLIGGSGSARKQQKISQRVETTDLYVSELDV